MARLLLVLHQGEGKERHDARALDGGGHLALVLGAVARDAPGDDLAALGDEVLQLGGFLVVHLEVLVGAVAADLPAAEAAASAALVAHPAVTAIFAASAPPAASAPARPLVVPALVSVFGHGFVPRKGRLFGIGFGDGFVGQVAAAIGESAVFSAERLGLAGGALRDLGIAGELHVGLHLPGGRIDVVADLDRLVLEHVVGHAEVALELRHHLRGAEIEEPEIDGAQVLLHLVGGLLLAPVLDPDHLAAFALDDAAHALDDLVDEVLGQIGPDEVDGLVLAQPRPCRGSAAGLRLCLLHRATSRVCRFASGEGNFSLLSHQGAGYARPPYPRGPPPGTHQTPPPPLRAPPRPPPGGRWNLSLPPPDPPAE